MVFIGDFSNKALSEKIASRLKAKVSYPDITIFPDGERRVRILTEVAGQKVAILKSLCPPVDNNILEFTFLVDAAVRNGADKIYGIVPYLGYSRADHMFRTGEAVPLEIVINLIQDAGLHKIFILDPHSIKILEMFSVPVDNETALGIFADYIKKMKIQKKNMTLVTPDMGGIRRIKMLSELFEGVEYASVEKDRDLETGALEIAEVHGRIKETCFIVDDMISSGETIVKAVDALLEQGAKKIYVMATHPVFSGKAVELLKNCRAEKVIVTDSIPVSGEKQFKKLEILSIDEIIAKSVREWLQ